MRSRAARSALLGLAALLAGGSGSASDLLYVVEDGQLVFTNTPRSNARPVPGFATVPAHTPARLPATIYDAFIERVAEEEGLSPELIKAVALVESALDPHAVSPKGARGLMQLMPATAVRYGVEDAFDPLENLRAGARHLRTLIDEFDGDLTLALAAYNAGSGAVRRHGGVPAYPETVDYVRKVRERLASRPQEAPRAERAPAEEPGAVTITHRPDGSVLLTN